MPLKVNFANVMPIIFAGAIFDAAGVFVPLHGEPAGCELDLDRACADFPAGWGGLHDRVCDPDSRVQFLLGGESVQSDPDCDNLKKEGAFIPGISPGQPTADYLDTAMTRVTAGGAVFLMVLALFPMFLYSSFNIPFMVAQFFGGTSLLIMVGVVLDTVSQLESHLTMRHYEGFLKSGRLRSRSGN